jgi:hypothetical protein
LGWRVATKPLPPERPDPEHPDDTGRALRAEVSLIVVAIGFALVGFLGGAILGGAILGGDILGGDILGTVLLVALAAARVPAGVVALAVADLVTGLVAGALTGGLVEAFGGRFQLADAEVRSFAVRSLIVAGTAGVVAGFLAAGLSGFPPPGVLLAALGVGAVSAAAGALILAARGALGNELGPPDPQ